MSARRYLRIPASPRAHIGNFYVDMRERGGYSFSRHGVIIERRPLPVGDYAAMRGDAVLGVVERKTLQGFARSLVGESLSTLMAQLAAAPLATLVVEGSYSDLVFACRHVRGSLVAEMIAQLLVRFPTVSINFLESRKRAEEFTYRYLCEVYAATDTT
jgi:ERCC4-type nuclease